jgi:hypothetical protein
MAKTSWIHSHVRKQGGSDLREPTRRMYMRVSRLWWRMYLRVNFMSGTEEVLILTVMTVYMEGLGTNELFEG